MSEDLLMLGDKTFKSRLIVGTGKYASLEQNREAVEASGAEMVTVAIRRFDLGDRGQGSLLDYISPEKYTYLPNTAGCYTAGEAIRTAELGREALDTDFVKLEVIGDHSTLFPDVVGLLEATKELVKAGFVVMPYTTDDPITAKKLEDLGAAAVMPLGAPIGSGLGLCNPYNIRIIMQTVNIPVIVDAGVGTASDAAIAMELGCHAVLMNTGIAGAKDPIAMARAMKLAVEGALGGGVRALELREKDLPPRDLYPLALEMRQLTQAYGARLLINDRVDVALAVNADGVHLATTSLPARIARQVLGPGRLIGVSTHTLAEAQAAAEQGADFVVFGPVFFTPSKAPYGLPVGLDALRAVRAAIKLPMLAIGGVKKANIDQ